jgi:hypothetical protein
MTESNLVLQINRPHFKVELYENTEKTGDHLGEGEKKPLE